ncbi:MAG: LPS assembly lipoprotein LptE [Gammaproteobacteria bacterium]|jgi:LPS-assembly lipoprotein
MTALTACGFHLRGSIELPAEARQVAIDDGKSATDIATSLNIHLRRNGIKPLQKIDKAKVVIKIRSESFQRRVLTVSSAGQVQEFELIYVVNYSINNRDNKDASLTDQTLTLRRDLRFNANEVLGKTTEEARLKQDMLDSAAQQILRRLPTVVGATPE